MSTYQIRQDDRPIGSIEASTGVEALRIFKATHVLPHQNLTAREKPLVLPHDEDGVSAVGSTKIVGYRATCRCHGTYWRGPVQDERVFALADLKAHREGYQA